MRSGRFLLWACACSIFLVQCTQGLRVPLDEESPGVTREVDARSDGGLPDKNAASDPRTPAPEPAPEPAASTEGRKPDVAVSVEPASSDAGARETAATEPRQPDVGQPDTRQPDTRQPDTRQPDTRQPDTGSPEKPGKESPPSDPGVSSYDCKRPHPAWLFCDDFEGLSAGFDTWFPGSGWTEALGQNDRGRVTGSTQAHRGKYALYMPAAASAGYRGADLVWRSCAGTNKPGCKPLKGYKTLYFRTFVRFASDHKKVHHFLNISGGPLDDYWAPYGNAGCRPNGQRAMGTTVDFKNGSHESFFYTYFPGMKCEPASICSRYANPAQICADCAKKGMPCQNGDECCWGNHFTPQPAVALPVGSWFCFEMMMRANDVGKSNGEMAYWINGKLAHQVNTMLWRKVESLQLNMVRLQHYLTTGDAQGHSNRVWFDDVVISTQRIGCQ